MYILTNLLIEIKKNNHKQLSSCYQWYQNKSGYRHNPCSLLSFFFIIPHTVFSIRLILEDKAIQDEGVKFLGKPRINPRLEYKTRAHFWIAYLSCSFLDSYLSCSFLHSYLSCSFRHSYLSCAHFWIATYHVLILAFSPIMFLVRPKK